MARIPVRCRHFVTIFVTFRHATITLYPATEMSLSTHRKSVDELVIYASFNVLSDNESRCESGCGEELGRRLGRSSAEVPP